MASQADLLRLWREYHGKTLEEVALAVELAATARSIDRKSRSVPRTHASMSRWENGLVNIKEIGLELIANAYGMQADDLRRPPPKPGEPRRIAVEVDEDQAEMVDAFLKAVKAK